MASWQVEIPAAMNSLIVSSVLRALAIPSKSTLPRLLYPYSSRSVSKRTLYNISPILCDRQRTTLLSFLPFVSPSTASSNELLSTSKAHRVAIYSNTWLGNICLVSTSVSITYSSYR